MKSKAAASQKLRVFISYSRRDIATADAVVEALEARGFDVLIDRRDLPYGEEWQNELADFIRASDTVLWLVSPHSVKSDWCNWELGLVGQLNKRLVPIAISETNLAEVPKAIGKIHVLPQAGVFALDSHLETLVEVLNTDRGWLKDATRLADRARQWLAKQRDAGLLLRGTALTDAEAWERRQPANVPAAPSEVLELILASRQAAARRQIYWVVGGLAVASALMMFGTVSFIFNLDKQINEARVKLRNNGIEQAASDFNAIAGSPIYYVLPTSASTTALADEILATGTSETLFAFDRAKAGGRQPGRAGGDESYSPLSTAGLQVHGARAVALTRIAGRKSVVDCDLRSRRCVASEPGPPFTGSASLVRDGADFYLLSADTQKRTAHLAIIRPSQPAQVLAPKDWPAGLVSLQGKKASADLYWTGKNFHARIGSGLFSQTPPILVEEKGNETACREASSIPCFPTSASAVFNERIGHATCSRQATSCVFKLMADARGTVHEYQVWGLRTRRDESAGIKTAWIMLSANVYTAHLSDAEVAISPSGRLLAIADRQIVRIWKTDALPRDIKAVPWRTYNLSQVISAIAFDEREDRLLVMTDSALRQLHIQPRLQLEKGARPNIFRNSPGFPGERDDGTNVEFQLSSEHRLYVLQSGVYLADARRRTFEGLIAATSDEIDFNADVHKLKDGHAAVLVSSSKASYVFNIGPDGSARERWRGPSGALGLALDGTAVVFVGDREACRLSVVPIAGQHPALHLPLQVAGGSCPWIERTDLRLLPAADAGQIIIIAPVISPISLVARIWLDPQAGLQGETFKMPAHNAEATFSASGTTYVISNEAKLFALRFDGGKPVLRSYEIGNGEVRALLKEALAGEGEGVRILPSGGDVFAIVVRSSTAKPCQEDDYVFRGHVLLFRYPKEGGGNQTITPSHKLECIYGLTPRSGRDTDGVLWHDGKADQAILGAYLFPGAIVWNLAQDSLQAFRFNAEDRDGKVAGVSELNVEVGAGGDDTAPRLVRISEDGMSQEESSGGGMTALTYAAKSGMTAFFAHSGASSGNAHVARLWDRRGGKVYALANESREFFDLLADVVFSPSGNILLTQKSTSGFELFDTRSRAKLPLPDGVAAAEFAADDRLEVRLADGAEGIWLLPEATVGSSSYLRGLLATAQHTTPSPP